MDAGDERPEVTAAERDVAADLVAAIHAGDIDAVRRLIGETPGLARDPLGGPFKTRTALHVVTDWPGYWPNGPKIVQLTRRGISVPGRRT